MGLEHKHAVLDALMTAVDEETALEIIDYRKRMGKRFHLTPRAAGMLARKLAACPDPVGAADEMMLRGWQSVEYDWLPAHRRQKAQQPRGIFGAALELMEERHEPSARGSFDALEFSSHGARH